MSRISKLSKLSNISRIGTSTSSTLRRAFGFDGTDDYISSNTTIGRTGYDMNVSGNVSTGSDGDGSYFWINGNRASGSGTTAQVSVAPGVAYTQATSFSIGGKFKVNAYAPTSVSGLFGSYFDAGIHYTATNSLVFGLRGSTTVQNTYTSAFTLGTYFYAHLVYDATVSKFYAYINGTLMNTGGTAGPATFSTDARALGDNAVTGSTQESSNKYIYHAAIRNKALTQAEIDADIALGNTTKNDPSIVAYYIPDNLQYNTQYMSNPTSLDNAIRTKSAGVTVTANTTVAPDGTTTADTVAFSGGSSISLYQTNTSITGATIASKTFIVKAFVKVTAGTSLFRLECGHAGVASYKSSDLTATTTRQEFTFTQAFTSSTFGTGVTGSVVNSSGATNPTLEVRNVRLFLVNETLRDESPNIGGFIGWKQNRVISCWLKPGVDGTGTFNSQPFFTLPYIYGYIRESTNSVRVRYSDRLGNNETSYTLGAGFRGKVHICTVPYFTGTVRANKLYINGVLQNTGSYSLTPSNTILQTNLTIGRYFTPTYFTGNIRDARIYTFTGLFTDADALAIYNGGEPTSAGVTKYLHYRPPVGEVGTTTQDQSTNDRDGTLNGGVTRDYI